MKNKGIILFFFAYLALVALIITATYKIPQASAADLQVGEKEVKIYFFWANGCPHCEKERKYLEQIKTKYPEVKVESYEVTGSQENLHVLQHVGEALGVEIRGVPFTVIGKTYLVGWYDEKSSGATLESAINSAITVGCEDVVGDILETEKTGCQEQPQKGKGIPEKIKIPIYGEIGIKNISLPALTVLLGAIDGFNPCAMWVLIFLISLLLGMQDKRRMWVLGVTFIITSAFVYFLFMAAWLNLFLFLGFVIWVRIIIGGVALASGWYNIREYVVNKDATCLVEGDEKKKKVFEKLKEITEKKNFWLALAGVITLAFAVNLVELICSAGLPAVYTQVLALSNLPTWQYYVYLFFYILVFMFDDLLIFIAAMVTLEIVGATNKYSRYSHLIGGIVMVIIGLLMWFKPVWLMFG